MQMLIYEMRSSRNMSIRKLAHMSGISIGALSNYENNKTYPTLFTLEIIAQTLECKITDLFESNYK